MPNMDPETAKQFEIASKMEAMFLSDAWKIAEEELDKEILELQSIRNITVEDRSNDQIVSEMAGRSNAIDILLKFKKNLYRYIEQAHNLRRTFEPDNDSGSDLTFINRE